MNHFICSTCGVQYGAHDCPPTDCCICQDERQYVGWNGQNWTTLGELQQSHRIEFRLEEVGLFGIGMDPSFAIGQRALLISKPFGNVLWDCIPLINDEIVEMVKGMGGISAIAISHPHYYTGMVEWAKAFDCPVYLHAADREWVMRSDPHLEFWDGESKALADGLTLIRCGGHFDGGTVLHWQKNGDRSGIVLSGDILQVVEDRRWVSFMYSYPNLIPLSASKVQTIVQAVEPYDFDRIYGAWWGKVVREDASSVVKRSAERYIRALESS